MKKTALLSMAIIFIAAITMTAVYYRKTKSQLAPAADKNLKTVNKTPGNSSKLSLPLYKALERVTKKPFGIYISPKNSPVIPEKFTGYHTGADFEIFRGEENKDISVFAICSGKLLIREFGRGYGGMIVEACDINGQSVTVVYGHLKLASVNRVIGDYINSGDVLGILGKGNSIETDYERKHLHLGIHKGSRMDTRGYIATKTGLINWIDPMTLLK